MTRLTISLPMELVADSENLLKEFRKSNPKLTDDEFYSKLIGIGLETSRMTMEHRRRLGDKGWNQF